MVKVVFFSDTHLGIDMPVKPKKDRRRRGPDYFNNFEKVLQFAVNNKADLLIHGGDLFDTPKVHQNIVNLAYEKLFNVADYGIPIVICPGNHERSILPPSLYLNHPDIKVFKKPEVFSNQFNKINIEIAGFPFVRKNIKQEFPNVCKTLNNSHMNINAIKLLLMHQAIEGAVVGPQQYMFKYGADVVQVKDIPNYYDMVLSGHIHPTQILKTLDNKPIIYPGSTERTAFAEKDEQKGFYEIYIQSKNEINLKFHPLDARPMEILRLEADTYNEHNIKQEIKKAIANYPKDAIVQIRLKNTEFAYLLKVKVLDELFPSTMNYQISGIRTVFNYKNRKS